MLQSAKSAVRSKAAAMAERVTEIVDRAGDALRAATLGLMPAPAPVPVRVRARQPRRQD
ncbi:hypothetical protein LOK46_26835 [Methylobacterium sp. NMS14P]|uniref:hypothetical protein n=1 Tax=unclassified Methylobacterium TaxID=2615210 RepID=UPI002359AC29|nr:hypothetical protein [Methylobacterium sp. NMS14P]WCS24703.1 hypothetical protein LOK46_26835 [Methylobacterium sp. NMS14P]